MSTFPPLPSDFTREDCIDGLEAIKELAEQAQKKDDPSFSRWPDIDLLFDYIKLHGFPPPK